VELTVEQARRVATQQIASLSERGAAVPAPRTLEEIRADVEWAKERSINWATAVISMVAVPANS